MVEGERESERVAVWFFVASWG